MELAIKNVDVVLKAAGLRAWEVVYLLSSYHCGIRTSWEPTAEASKKRIPSHRAVRTAIGVADLEAVATINFALGGTMHSAQTNTCLLTSHRVPGLSVRGAPAMQKGLRGPRRTCATPPSVADLQQPPPIGKKAGQIPETPRFLSPHTRPTACPVVASWPACRHLLAMVTNREQSP